MEMFIKKNYFVDFLLVGLLVGPLVGPRYAVIPVYFSRRNSSVTRGSYVTQFLLFRESLL
jgi:hypothetical protein